ncbi:LysE family translocator [Rouxiella badensis]|uniref:LysE family translocator n=1 Tax=Rouxiella badensis TaxID=1646377 RepID=UPI0017887547|nr:LysE family translocator [Rouxiella badensis]QOI54620.1 LysE family translocator [Rouxiella badensis subsp. acadiensis]
MNLTLLSAYILSVLMLLLTPGPVVALVTGTAARHGYRKAFATVVGTNGASLVLIAFAALMLAGVVSLKSIYLYVLGTVGSIFIGYMAVQGLIGLSKTETAIDEELPAPVIQSSGGFFRGFMTGISNPKDILFFVSFFPQFITVTRDFGSSIMTLSLVWIFFDFSVLTLYILAVRRWVPAKHSKKFELASSIFLLGVAFCGVIYYVGEIISSLNAPV